MIEDICKTCGSPSVTELFDDGADRIVARKTYVNDLLYEMVCSDPDKGSDREPYIVIFTPESLIEFSERLSQYCKENVKDE